MRRVAAILAVSCSVGCGGSAGFAAMAASAAPMGHSAGASALAASCVYGKIGGVRKCLRAGEYCARRYRSQYPRYGFSCSKRDDRGDWHLVRT